MVNEISLRNRLGGNGVAWPTVQETTRVRVIDAGQTAPRHIRVGIIGGGAIAERHFEGIQRHGRSSVCALAEPNARRREELVRRHHIQRAYETAEELIQDQDLDAVTIAVPNVFHAPLATRALQAGKHVLLEKPFATCLADARRIADAARHSGKILMVGMNQRFQRETQAIKSRIDAGELGDVYHAKTFWMRRSGIPKFGTWFCRKDMAGGGSLLDIGVHMLDLSLYLMDNFRPEAVSGAVYSNFGPRGLGEGDWGASDPETHPFDVEDSATALVKLEGGATVTLDVAWAMHQEQPDRRDVVLYGTEGGASLLPTPRLFRRLTDAKQYAAIEPSGEEMSGSCCCRFANWLDAILGEAAPLCTIEQALAVQVIIDAVYTSAISGHEVRLPRHC